MFLYKVYAPAPALQPFVNNYSIVENSVPVVHNILPKAALILGIKYGGNMELSTQDQVVSEGFVSGLMGIQDSYRVFSKTANTGMLAINFTEAGAGAFFNVPLNELYNSGYTLDLFVRNSSAAQLEEEISIARSADERVRIAERFLFSILRQQEQDKIILASLEAIRQANGIIRTDDLARQLYISSSRFEKRFRNVVGTSPKKFASMIRIESIIKGYQNNSPLTKLAYDSGYFDQAHFNRDFKNYTGLSPKQLFANWMVGTGNVQQPCGFIYGGDVMPVRTNNI